MRIISVTILLALLTMQSALADEHEDIVALRALDQAYASEWIEGDADGVMALFTEDATIVPHHDSRGELRDHCRA